MADGQDHGGAMAAVTDPQQSLAAIRTLTAAALAGMPTGEPAFDCLGVVARECGITARMAEDVIEGFALDAADWHPRRESDLYQYCYHVAGAVGVPASAFAVSVRMAARLSCGSVTAAIAPPWS